MKMAVAGIAKMSRWQNVDIALLPESRLSGQAINNHDPARLVIALHKKAPVTVSRPGAFH